MQVQIWQGRLVTLLHGVTLERETIRGVPFTMPPTCDSCRMQLARSAVDSLRVGNKERGFARSAGLFLLIGLAMAHVFRGVGGS
jgi:hypothetical protein